MRRGPSATLSTISPFVYEFTKKTPKIKQGTGNAPAILLRLPEFKTPYSVRVFVHSKGIRKVGLIVPVVSLFDKDYHLTSTCGEDFAKVFPPGSGSYEVHIESTIPITDAAPAFVLLSTDSAKVGQQAQFVQRYYLGSPTSGYKIYRVMEGKIKMEVLDSMSSPPQKAPRK
jgi:hypothetical protein